MASSGAPAAPYSFGVFLVSDLDTHLAIEGFSDDTVASLKRKIEEEHARTFPEMGEIIVNAVKVESEGRLYRLANSVVIGRIITKSYLMLHIEIVLAHQNEQNIERLEGQISEAESIVLDKSQVSFESEDEGEGSEDDSVHGEQMLCQNQGESESETNNQAEIETDNDSLCDHEEINQVSEANYEVASNVETKKENSRERKDVEGDLGENKRRKKSQNTREVVPETEMDIDTDNESKEACETEKSTNNGNNEPIENQEKIDEGITESENPIPDFNQEITESENPIPDSNQEIMETGNPIPEFNQEIMESENPIPDSNQGDKRKKKKSKQSGKKKERSVIDTDEIIPESQTDEDIGNAEVATDRVNPNQEPEPNQETSKAKCKSKKGSMNENETSQETTSALNGEPVVGFEGNKRRKKSKSQSKNASEFETLVLAASCQQENENNQVELDSNLVENENPPKKDEKKKRKQEVGSTIESDEMNIETNQNDNILETAQEKRKKKKRKQKVESIKESDEMVIETNQNENNLETVQERKKKSSKKRGSKEKAAKLPEASSDKSEETLNPQGLDDLAFSNNISKDESGDVTPGSNVEKKRSGDNTSVLYLLKRSLIWPRFLGAQVVTKRLKFLHHNRNWKKRIYSSK